MKGCKTLKTRTFSKQECLFDSKMIAVAAFVLFRCVGWREWLAGAGTQLLSKGSADFREGRMAEPFAITRIDLRGNW